MNRRAKLMVVVVAIFMATVVGANFFLILKATTDPSFAVETDYYQKALDWDAQQEARLKSDALGWSAKVDASRDKLVLELSDRGGEPIADAHVRVEAFHSARASQRVRAELQHDRDGVYSLRRSFERPGLWAYRFVAERGPPGSVERYQKTLEVNVP
ncbi:MAG: FixH family protein [Deltaproteobacteria bacterium]|nr:FixH family protein [Deltaproteobacteria bacterium]